MRVRFATMIRQSSLKPSVYMQFSARFEARKLPLEHGVLTWRRESFLSLLELKSCQKCGGSFFRRGSPQKPNKGNKKRMTKTTAQEAIVRPQQMRLSHARLKRDCCVWKNPNCQVCDVCASVTAAEWRGELSSTWQSWDQAMNSLALRLKSRIPWNGNSARRVQSALHGGSVRRTGQARRSAPAKRNFEAGAAQHITRDPRDQRQDSVLCSSVRPWHAELRHQS